MTHAPLTKRQSQVFDLLRLALSNQQIADELGISRATVRIHVSQVLGKMGCERRAQIAMMQEPRA